ncbi:MAG: hypothetical protein J5965_06300 [Aeriscardovia sp.]|nr:hypothetical protein [Aeriscardovia sp.]
MGISKETKMRLLPWLLIVLGFLTLNMFQGYFAITCMVIGIVMFIERIWPEQWDTEKRMHGDC